MNKKLSKLLLLPLGVSLLLPGAIASADATKTTANFQDLAGIDAALKAKIDALLSKGVFDGVSNDNFGIDQNMTRAQFAKVLTLIYGVNIDSSVKSSSFADVGTGPNTSGWAIPYIEAAKKAGLLNGRTDGTFDPGNTVTMGEFAVGLLRGLGEKPDISGTPWYADAVKQAIEQKLIPSDATGKQKATRADLVSGAFSGNQAYEEKKKQEEEQNNGKDDDSKEPQNNNNNNNNSSTPSDTTAPTITGATINDVNVKLNGVDGTVGLRSSESLNKGTITVSEASTLTVTAVEGITLTDYAALSTSQTLVAGENKFNLIEKLGTLDHGGNGISMALLNSLDKNQDGFVISGTLRDSAGNSTNVTLTIKADDAKPNLTAATINGSPVTINNNTGSFTLGADAYLKTGTITADENAAFKVTGIKGIVDLTAYPALTYSKDLRAGTAETLNLATFLGSADAQGDGLSVSQLKVLTGAANSLTLTGTLTDEAGNVREVSLTLTLG
ncbi:S-layer homology domain-containing protein [Paenibacillus sp. PR3]|uniref:S-layer homology domain-containing protein n=1 Tax=Paenibacillus terricola TaxID=2763503 RepID=A0ABR8N3P4_9BACL|nr:S-layer homology domain-containing protein [Paenibacillus terricola]MBD3921891.1 S-layer homology domain-containing protein [Paenibacillus terricola]